MNKKFIIILGVLSLLLIISIGIITYYEGKEKQVQQSFGEKKDFTLNYQSNSPSNFKELSSFIKILKNAVFLGGKELESTKEIRTVGLYMPEESFISNFDIIKNYLEDKYISFIPLESISELRANQYFGISVNTQDVIQVHSDSLLLEGNMLHFCTISEPALVDPLFEEIESKNDFWFNEGGISCMEVNSNEDHAIIFVGFIPQAELINIKLYLVDDFTILDIRNAQSFLEMEEILDNYNILWQMEKPINL